jgi:hypothetical protein
MTVLYITYAQGMDYRGLNEAIIVTFAIYHTSRNIREHSQICNISKHHAYIMQIIYPRYLRINAIRAYA